MTTSTYTVTGMTCGHCVNAVTQEVSGLPGVTGVDVDLKSGSVTVTSEAPLDQAQVQAAVEEAGYQLVA
ncbi:MAG TPA: heavy-metal-associated domain-containing protein [Acidimicrobiales bacterium]|nr:heavy-metal-associated domain-containing protein [Acidimicrobiales bacterium]